MYGRIWCVYGISSRGITKCTVVYGVCTVFLVGQLGPNKCDNTHTHIHTHAHTHTLFKKQDGSMLYQ